MGSRQGKSTHRTVTGSLSPFPPSSILGWLAVPPPPIISSFCKEWVRSSVLGCKPEGKRKSNPICNPRQCPWLAGPLQTEWGHSDVCVGKPWPDFRRHHRTLSQGAQDCSWGAVSQGHCWSSHPGLILQQGRGTRVGTPSSGAAAPSGGLQVCPWAQ